MSGDDFGLLGAVLGERWRVDGVLGEGGMAVVFAATHRNGHEVALKVLRPEFAGVPEIRDRFLREAYAANRVGHSHVVAVLDDALTPSGLPFLVMERLRGETVDRRLGRGDVFSPREILALARDILGALVAAHGKQVFHRDLKPENLFLAESGKVMLLDFGIAQMRGPQSTTVTMAGTIMGTPCFMPPEQARGRWDELDGRSDLFSLGATMWTMATGVSPRDAATPNEVLLLAMTAPIPPLGEVCPRVGGALAAIVDRAVSLAVAARFPDARAMLVAVESALSKAPSTSETPRPPSTPPRVPLATAMTAAADRHITLVPRGSAIPLTVAGLGVLVAVGVGLAVRGFTPAVSSVADPPAAEAPRVASTGPLRTPPVPDVAPLAPNANPSTPSTPSAEGALVAAAPSPAPVPPEVTPPSVERGRPLVHPYKAPVRNPATAPPAMSASPPAAPAAKPSPKTKLGDYLDERL